MKLAALSGCLLTAWKPRQIARSTKFGMLSPSFRIRSHPRTSVAGRGDAASPPCALGMVRTTGHGARLAHACSESGQVPGTRFFSRRTSVAHSRESHCRIAAVEVQLA
jgi:hypothetical protein